MNLRAMNSLVYLVTLKNLKFTEQLHSVCFEGNNITMSRRQIQIQAINRSLEHKILLLKEQNKIISSRQEERYHQMEAHFTRLIQEKDQMIQGLQDDLGRSRDQLSHERSRDTERQGERSQEAERWHRKCGELEKRLQAMTERYEMRVKELEGETSRWQQRWQEQSSSHAVLSSQVNQLTRYYVQARSHTPLRKQTLQWTEKLMDLIDEQKGTHKEDTEKAIQAMKSSICALKHDIVGSIQATSQLEESIMKQRSEVAEEIKKIMKEQNQIGDKVLTENDKFWQMVRKEKQSSDRQKLSQVEGQLREEQAKWEQEKEELAGRLKALQTERKTLLMGFTELKSLNQGRQKILKDENSSLKEAIDSLLEKSQHREHEYSKQTQQLHEQLATLSKHYYDNIEIPFQRVLQNLDTEIKRARTELERLSQNSSFNQGAQKLQAKLQVYLVQKSKREDYGVMIGHYIEHSTRLLDSLEDRMEDAGWISPQETDRSDEMFKDKGMILRDNLRELEWKETQNKLHYQIATLKKHNGKLKDYASSLEAKIKEISPSHSRRRPTSSMEAAPDYQELMLMEAQIQRLKLENRAYREQYLSEIEIMKDKLQDIQDDTSPNHQASAIKNSLRDLRDFNQRMVRDLQLDHDLGEEVSQLVVNLNTLLAKPTQIFDTFLARVELHQPTRTLLPPNYQPQQLPHPLPSSIFAPLREAYADIAMKRQQNSSHTQKVVGQLIRVMRDTAPPARQRKDIDKKKEQKVEEKKERKEVGIDKKIRQVQTQRIKLREQVLKRLEKIDEGLRNLESRTAKKPVATIAKIQQFLDRKLENLQERYLMGGQMAQQLGELGSAALRDIQEKLRQCMTENEGLVREVQCLRQIKSSE